VIDQHVVHVSPKWAPKEFAAQKANLHALLALNGTIGGLPILHLTIKQSPKFDILAKHTWTSAPTFAEYG